MASHNPMDPLRDPRDGRGVGLDGKDGHLGIEIAVERHLLFEDTLHVNSIDYKKFEKTPRLYTKGLFTDADIALDVNIEAYPIDIHDRLQIVIYNNVSPTGGVMTDFYDHDPRMLGPSIMDEYEYVMYGIVYDRKNPKGGKDGLVTIHISFGGLLMRIKVDAAHCQSLELDNWCYLLCRKEQ